MENETGNTTLDRVRSLVTPILTDLKLDLYDLEFRSGTLRITVDVLSPSTSGAPTDVSTTSEEAAAGTGQAGEQPAKQRGVNLDEIALATRLISKELDQADPVPGRYTLEVSSPGLERTLRTPAHFQRELGKTVAIRLRDVTNGQRRFNGTLIAADETAIEVDVDGEIRRVDFAQIDRARTVYDWTPKPKPGHAPKPKTTQRKPDTVPDNDTVLDNDTMLDNDTVPDNDTMPDNAHLEAR